MLQIPLRKSRTLLEFSFPLHKNHFKHRQNDDVFAL